MKRVLKFATILLVSVTFLMPLLECFDGWDKPGLTNDTEFPVFLLVLFVALVLLAVGAMARSSFDRQRETIKVSIAYRPFVVFVGSWADIVIAPYVSPPLRI
jgi:hypothetical protein